MRMRGTLLHVLLVLLIGSSVAVTPEDCEDSEFHLDPENCPHSYYRCYKNSQGGWDIEKHDCPAGTDFNPAIEACDWADNVPDDVCDGLTTSGPTDNPTDQPTDAPTDGPTDQPTYGPTDGPTDNPNPGNDKRTVCYFGSWAFYRTGGASFDIDDIDPSLCTHICYGFANMDNQTWKAVAYDPWYDLAPWDEGCDGDHCHYDSFRRFNRLKEKNPKLKTLLSIGGWNTGSGQWSEMAIDPAKRKTFIDSAVLMAKTFGFDGIDFDWEYPGDREGSDAEHDKEDFTNLVEEFSSALHGKNLLLTAATSPDFKRLEVGVDMPRVSAALDFINVMDYDYHGAWDEFTGLNTPLYGRTEEDNPDHPGHRFNVNDTINYYLSAGADPLKLNLGVAAYGRGFELPKGTNDNGLYCPTEGPIVGGPHTGEAGMWSYLEILEAFNNDSLPVLPDATPHGWTDTIDGCYKAPYTINGPYWIGYDNPESIALKAQMANYRGLGGIMVFGLDLDDFKGKFGESYPITKTAKRIMDSGKSLAPEDIIGENSGCESAPMCDVL